MANAGGLLDEFEKHLENKYHTSGYVCEDISREE